MADRSCAPRANVPVPANPDLPGMPLDLRVNRAEFHLVILRTLGSGDWSTFAGMEIEDFVDWVADLGMEVWYTQPGGIGGHTSDRLHAWYADPLKSALTFDTSPPDLAERFLRRAHAHGILAICTFNMNLWETVGMLHPEWRIRDLPDGRAIRPNTSFLCHNSPFGDFLVDYLEDYVSRFDVDGVWFDDCNYGSRGASPFPAGCTCRWCAERFRAEAGAELPQRVDFASLDFKRWVRWRYCNLREYQNRIASSVRAIRDVETVRFNSYPRPHIPWTSANELAPITGGAQFFIETEYPLLGPHLTAKVARARGDCEIWGHAPQPIGPVGWAPYQEPTYMARVTLGALANGVHVQSPVDYHHPEQQRLVFAELARRRAFVGGDSLRQCALHLSQRTRDFHYAAHPPVGRDLVERFRQALDADPELSALAQGPVVAPTLRDLAQECEGSDRYWKQWAGVAEMLERSHIPFDVLFDDGLTAEGLDGYRVLVLPDSVCLSDAECAAITSWVEDGGTLVATYQTSLADEWGDRRDDFGLGEAFGLRYRGTYDAGGDGGSIYVLHDPLTRHGAWIGFDGQHTEVAAPGADTETLATLSVFRSLVLHPLGSAVDESDTDRLDSGHAAITAHRHGRGLAIYVSGDVGAAFCGHPVPRLAALFADLVRQAGLALTIDAPPRLLAAARARASGDGGDGSRIHVHLYERMLPLLPWDRQHPDVQTWGALDPLTEFRDVAITLHEGRIARARLPLSGRELTVTDGTVVVPEVVLHEVVELTLAP